MLVRRETGKRSTVKVPAVEGLATHTGSESCAHSREVMREALTGVHIGQPLSGENEQIWGAHALLIAEGNTVEVR